MAQIWLGEKAETSERDESVDGKAGSLPTYKFASSRSYLIIADTILENESHILANPNVPGLGSTDVFGDPIKKRGAKLVSRIARHPETGVVTNLWEVEVSSDSKLSFTLPGSEVEFTDLDPIVRWEVEEEEVAFDYDMVDTIGTSPKPVANANGEPFFATRKVYFPVAVITRFEPYPFDPTINFAYGNRLNELEFWGAPPKSALMMPIEAEPENDEDGGIIYSKVTYRIKFKVGDFYTSEPWKARILNEGFYVRPAAGELPVLNKVEGNATKINLQANGTAVTPGAPPVYLEFNQYKTVDWTALNLYLPDNDPNT